MYAYGMKGKCGCGCCGNYILKRVVGFRHRIPDRVKTVSRSCKKALRRQVHQDLQNWSDDEV